MTGSALMDRRAETVQPSMSASYADDRLTLLCANTWPRPGAAGRGAGAAALCVGPVRRTPRSRGSGRRPVRTFASSGCSRHRPSCPTGGTAGVSSGWHRTAGAVGRKCLLAEQKTPFSLGSCAVNWGDSTFPRKDVHAVIAEPERKAIRHISRTPDRTTCPPRASRRHDSLPAMAPLGGRGHGRWISSRAAEPVIGIIFATNILKH